MFHDTPVVAGESAEVLFEALRQFDLREQPDGMFGCEIDLPPELHAPFWRALNRIADELEQGDVVRQFQTGWPQRTSEQRLADAFLMLAIDVGDALINRAA